MKTTFDVIVINRVRSKRRFDPAELAPVCIDALSLTYPPFQSPRNRFTRQKNTANKNPADIDEARPSKARSNRAADVKSVVTGPRCLETPELLQISQRISALVCAIDRLPFTAGGRRGGGGLSFRRGMERRIGFRTQKIFSNGPPDIVHAKLSRRLPVDLDTQ